jgi:hypothetical protein
MFSPARQPISTLFGDRPVADPDADVVRKDRLYRGDHDEAGADRVLDDREAVTRARCYRQQNREVEAASPESFLPGFDRHTL